MAGQQALSLVLGAGAVLVGLGLGLTLSPARDAGSPERGPERAAASPALAEPGPGEAAGSENVEMLLEALIDEVRGLRTVLATDRRPAGVDPVGASEPAELGDLTAALDRLTQAMRGAGGGGGGFGSPGWGLTHIQVPRRTPRWDLIAGLLDVQDEHERVRPYLLWNYQQVLDHFGPPSAVWDGDRWMYEDPASGRQAELHFAHGLLIHVY